MKRSLLFVITLLLTLSTTKAQEQEERSDQAFRFIYIVHDTSTPVERLIELLYDAENRTLGNNQKCMVCLSNGISTREGEEYLVATILEGSDYEPAFDKIREELRNENAHDFDISRDVDYIINVFNNEHDFLNENGELYYESMTFDFYLPSQFCDNGHAGKLITPLYLAFDVPNMPNHFYFNVWIGADSIKDYDYSPERIFGEKNYNNINEDMNINIMSY